MKIFLMLFLFCLSCFGVHAKTITATYDADALGMRVMSATLVVNQNKDIYDMKTTTQSRGIMSLLMNGKQTFYSSGKIINNTLKPHYFSHQTPDRKREVHFEKESLLCDYQTAVLSVMHLSPPSANEAKYIAYDGRRELLLTFKHHGTRELKNGAFKGMADYYTLSIDVVKGKKKGWFFERTKNKDNPPLRLWFKKVMPNEPAFLVRAEFDTSIIGTAEIELKEVK